MKLSRPVYAPDPPAGTPPAGAVPPNGDPVGGAPPEGAKMPEGLDPKYWDASGGRINQDALLKDFTELSSFRQQQEVARAALPRKPEDVKLNIKLPEGFKLPEGAAPKIDENDPRVPMLREIAVKGGFSQDQIDAIVTLDAMAQVKAHEIESARQVAEKTKLGEKAQARIDAAKTYLGTALGETGAAALMDFTTDAASFEALETLIGLATRSSVPGAAPPGDQSKPPPQRQADRWYSQSQQKAG